MVSPARRRAAVHYLVRRHKVSQRRACHVIGQHRSTQRYQGKPGDHELRLVKAINALAQLPNWRRKVRRNVSAGQGQCCVE